MSGPLTPDVLQMEMMRIIRIALLAAALYMPLRAGLIYLGDSVAVDNCLDMGGSFNYETMTCDFEKSHPYVPFDARHPNIFKTAGLCFITGIVLFAGTWLFPKRKIIHAEQAGPAYPPQGVGSADP